MEVKTAFGVLSDPQQRSEYDRRQRAGSWGNWRPTGGASDYGWGGSGGAAGGSGGGGQRRPKQQDEEFYGLVSVGGLFVQGGWGGGLWKLKT